METWEWINKTEVKKVTSLDQESNGISVYSNGHLYEQIDGSYAGKSLFNSSSLRGHMLELFNCDLDQIPTYNKNPDVIEGMCWRFVLYFF